MPSPDGPEPTLGAAALRPRPEGGEGGWVEREGGRYLRIRGYDSMAPFLVSVVSGHDHWMFVSSTGGLTCGRRSPDEALFPYRTDDQVHDAWATTGPRTVLRVERERGSVALWEPFTPGPRVYELERNLDKHVVGHELVFAEECRDLGLAFSYAWTSGDRFGFVRRCELRNCEDTPVRVELLDGLRNLLPPDVGRAVQAEFSTLVDAYKQAEAVPGACGAVYALSSVLTDRAEPREALRSTVAWCVGLAEPDILLCEDQVEAFREGTGVKSEANARGKRGAFLLHTALELAPGETRRWYVVADIGLGPARTVDLVEALRAGLEPAEIEADVAANATRLERLVGAADGFQRGADERVTVRHFQNTLCNIMRGGVFPRGYVLPREDLLDFVAERDRRGRGRAAEALAGLEEPLTLEAARRLAAERGDLDLERWVHEYLPLTFSRRHGDPSRPWNHFSIELTRPDGSEQLAYQGNWRDIFQNWEALSLSFPEYLESFIAKFLNASTADGYNPYRISREGIDWEVPEPDVPWANIGYWGDHQVVYLERLLALSRAYHPGRLAAWLARPIFAYADVPYRIRPYAELLRDPRDSIVYDTERAARVAERVAAIGGDGKLAVRPDGELLRANLAEKLLLVALVRLANLVPDGGIWMNTQRPEWNDANNALVGYGLSMVTLAYLRRFLRLVDALLEESAEERLELSREIAAFLEDVAAVLRERMPPENRPSTPAERRAFLDAMGAAGDAYRARVYAGLSGERTSVACSTARELLRLGRDALDRTLAGARREDGLFHAYRLLRFDEDGVAIESLDEMLEGQVAVLSSGFLDARESLALLDALRASRLYCPRRRSYMLQPDREPTSFLERNVVPPERVASHPALQRLAERPDSAYLERDSRGGLHFRPEFQNAALLRAALERDAEIDEEAATELLALYEEVFQHRRFIGRSGSMCKYEGLGSIYWHMVSKLHLAALETLERARDEGADAAWIERLGARCDEIGEGIGVHASPAEYGAFPTDPYSHTPSFAGVQQPGLTGQVKEDVIARFRRLGVRVADGRVSFAPLRLSRGELLAEPALWRYSTGGEPRELEIPAGALAFTLCGVPVVYRPAERARVRVVEADGGEHVLEGAVLDEERSRALFRREGRLARLVVELPQDAFV